MARCFVVRVDQKGYYAQVTPMCDLHVSRFDSHSEIEATEGLIYYHLQLINSSPDEYYQWQFYN